MLSVFQTQKCKRTSRPASLLCRSIRVLMSLLPFLCLVSMNWRDFSLPKSTSSPQPPHSQRPLWTGEAWIGTSSAWKSWWVWEELWRVTQPHCGSAPWLQACVTACITPAAVMAYKNAVSRISRGTVHRSLTQWGKIYSFSKCKTLHLKKCIVSCGSCYAFDYDLNSCFRVTAHPTSKIT